MNYYFNYSSGVENGNLRELALARMADYGMVCRDVRTREVGIQEVHNKVRPYEVRVLLMCLVWPNEFLHLLICNMVYTRLDRIDSKRLHRQWWLGNIPFLRRS